MVDVEVPKGVTLSSEEDARVLVRALELAKDRGGLEYDTEAIVAVCDFYTAHHAGDVDVDGLAENPVIADAINMAREDGASSPEEAIELICRAYAGRL